jgi:hypothetical protein
MRHVPAAVLCLLASAVPLAACKATVDRTGQSSRGFYAGSYDMLWEMATRELARSGFIPDQENSSRENRTLVSRWSVSLSPFTAKGFREQATLTFHPVEGRSGYWTVEANVLRQVNKAMREPSNALAAEWDAGTRRPDVEMRLVHDVEMAFISRDVSPEFRARYGMGGAPDVTTPPRPPGGYPPPAPPPRDRSAR